MNGFSAEPGCRGDDGAVDRAAVLARRSSRPIPPTPATRRVALSSTTTATLGAPCRSSTARWLRMMPATSACSPASSVVSIAAGRSAAGGRRAPSRRSAARRTARVRREDEALGCRLARLLGREHAGRLPSAGARRCCRASAGARVAVRVEARRPLRQAGEERRLRRRQHRRVAAEVRVAGAPRADDLVAVRREVQIQREDLALGQADARAAARAPPPAACARDAAARARGACRLSSSFATCCVIVEPPSTTCALARCCARARAAIAIGSTPGCVRSGDPPPQASRATSIGGRSIRLEP